MRMLGQPDPRACRPGPAGGSCCTRGTVGCELDHDGPPVVIAPGIEACISTSMRPSPDFAGCVE
jgi:hypothetical protein